MDDRIDTEEPHIWITRDGDEIPVPKMEDRHLVNTIAMLERKAAKALNDGYQALCFYQGEAALDSVQADIDREQDFYNEWIGIMRGELAERKRKKEND